MGRRTDQRRKGQTSSYEKAMYRNLVTDLLGYEKVTTTEAKAKRVCGLAEEMITLGKKGGLHQRRQALSFIFDKKVTDKVFGELAERYANRTGGYTRVTKLGQRLGDGAPTVVLELMK
jgi:large subunit ribosomal protein L17